MQANNDSGFALIFVLFVTTVVLIGTATMLTVTTDAIKPARQSQDTAAAFAAAQAGVQQYLAMLDADCAVASIAQCPILGSTSASAISGVIGTERYSASAVNPGTKSDGGYLSLANSGTLFVTATGTSPVTANGVAATGAVTRTLTAAVSGVPSPLRLAYFSNYETVGSSFLNSYFGPRQVAISSSSALSALGIPSTYPTAVSATATWGGASTSSPTGLGDNICDKLWYDAASNANDGDTSNAGRSTLKSGRSALQTGADYRETGGLQAFTIAGIPVGTSAPETRDAPCETTFTGGDSTGGEKFNGPVYSRDAFYLSNGTTGTSGPTFSVPAKEPLPALWTGWTNNNQPAANVTTPYRSFPVVGGTPVLSPSTQTVSTSPFGNTLSLPTSIGMTAGTCTFVGPTQISLSGSSALVTSPLTTTSPGTSCPGSSGTYTVPVTTTTIYVKNATGSLASDVMSSSNHDITYYSKSAGDAYVSGTLSTGKLSIVTDDDIIVTGSILASHSITGSSAGPQPSTPDPASGEPSWSAGSAAIDLVATNDVRVYHPVSCASGSATYGANANSSPSAAAPNGWCPNDITGLYQTTQSNLVVDNTGALRTGVAPSLQYINAPTVNPAPSEIDAAVFALNGSFYADNFDRAAGVGSLVVSGGVYENHHGPLGEQWETPTNATARGYSGFKLQVNYLNYSNAGLGYVPELTGGSSLDPWQILSVTSGGPS